MKTLFFIFLIAINLTLDLISINILQNTIFNLYIPSLCLISISIFLICIEAILWLFNYSEKTQTGIICINFLINISKSTFFSIVYYTNTIPQSIVILSFLTFIISLIVGFLNINNNSVEPLKYIITQHAFVEEDKNCTICLKDFIKNEIIHMTSCKHFFHISCMKELIKNNIKTCPICRGSLSIDINKP